MCGINRCSCVRSGFSFARRVATMRQPFEAASLAPPDLPCVLRSWRVRRRAGDILLPPCGGLTSPTFVAPIPATRIIAWARIGSKAEALLRLGVLTGGNAEGLNGCARRSRRRSRQLRVSAAKFQNRLAIRRFPHSPSRAEGAHERADGSITPQASILRLDSRIEIWNK